MGPLNWFLVLCLVGAFGIGLLFCQGISTINLDRNYGIDYLCFLIVFLKKKDISFRTSPEAVSALKSSFFLQKIAITIHNFIISCKNTLFFAIHSKCLTFIIQEGQFQPSFFDQAFNLGRLTRSTSGL